MTTVQTFLPINFKELGKRMRAIRKLHNLTQAELAEKLNTISTHLSNIERGEASPSLALIHSFANYFHLSLDDLFQDSLIYRSIRAQQSKESEEQKRLQAEKNVDEEFQIVLSDCSPAEKVAYLEVFKRMKEINRTSK